MAYQDYGNSNFAFLDLIFYSWLSFPFSTTSVASSLLSDVMAEKEADSNEFFKASRLKGCMLPAYDLSFPLLQSEIASLPEDRQGRCGCVLFQNGALG